MKHSIFLYVFVFFITNLFAVNEISLSKLPSPPPPPPMPTICNGQFNSTMQTVNSGDQEDIVSASISETQLAVYFEQSVGDATITVCDAENNVVYTETIDTNDSFNLFVPCSSWGAGSFSLTITYGATTLTGFFELE